MYLERKVSHGGLPWFMDRAPRLCVREYCPLIVPASRCRQFQLEAEGSCQIRWQTFVLRKEACILPNMFVSNEIYWIKSECPPPPPPTPNPHMH